MGLYDHGGRYVARDSDIAAAIMRNARAAWRDQLRNQVRAGQPDLGDADVEARVDELVRAARSAGGRRGAAQTRRTALAARNLLDSRGELAEMARVLLARIEALADPTGDCLHLFDDTGDYCQRCGAEAGAVAA